MQAGINSADRWGGTALQDALTGGHASCAALLKGKGAEYVRVRVHVRVCGCM